MSPTANLEFAGLEICFEAEDPRALQLVRAATVISPSVVAGRNHGTPALRASLAGGALPRWVPEGKDRARAESPLDPDLFAAVLRAAMCHTLAPDGALLHAAGIAISDQGILLVAPSEGGKTTISGLLSNQADILSDETICVRPDSLRSGHYTIFGSCFWSGPIYPGRAGGFPLRAICFLRKGPLSLAPLSRARALRELLAEIHLPIGPTAVADSLRFAAQLVESASIHTLTFSLDSAPGTLLRELVAKAAE